ncbi:MAG: BspA family leucine-rich repeat surface protein [Bacilli bacterium]|nr:BspA family leucine-rich repeat surface protein [Bacilli bacterium]
MIDNIKNIFKNKDKHITIGVVFIMLLISIFTLIKLDVTKNIFKLKAASITLQENEAMFDIGENVNQKMKVLAGDNDADSGSTNENIISIKRSTALSITPTNKNIVSTSDSSKPIYIWFNNGTIYWYSDAAIVYLNSNSESLFKRLGALKTIPELNQIDTSKVTNMHWMFLDCSSLTSLNLSNFNTSNVTNMVYMFGNCSSLTSLNLSSFNTSKVTNMGWMFSKCKSLTSLDLSNFDTSKVTSMALMFEYCSSLTSLNLSSFDTSNVTSMNRMFYGCSSLTSLNLGNFNTNKVTSMSSMFSDCSSLTSLDLSNFDTNKVTSMEAMFWKCSSLTNLNLSSFDTSNVTDMSWMFLDCSNLTSLDLSSFNTSNVTDMWEMFSSCTNLRTIYVSAKGDFDVSNVTVSSTSSFNTIFSGSTSLKGMNGTTYDSNHVDKEYARIDKSGTPGYFSIKKVTIPTCTNKTYNTQEQTLLKAHTTGDYINSILKGTNAGNYNTSLTLTGNYQWSDGSTNTTRILTCKINPYDMSNAIIASTSDQIYSGNEIKPEPSITALSKTLIKNTDYTLSYTNNINTGRATITVTGKGNYTGSKISTFNITEVDLSNLDIKDDLYVILSKFNTKFTIEDMIKINVTIIRNDEELSDTESLTTGDILKIGSLSYSIVILGDPNKDGSVDGADISRIYKIYRGITTATTLENYAADANKDGYVDGADISRTYKIYRGLYQD